MPNYSLLIKSGNIIDGTGNPWFKKDIGIVGDKIVNIGIINNPAKETIDATGMVVSPGFIDLHNHSDMTILAFPNATNCIKQGITTVITGNCGMSMAPINSNFIDILKKYLSFLLVKDYDYKWDWNNLDEFYKKIENKGISINIIPLVGHGTIRLAVKGFDSSNASKEDINKMKILLEESIKDGVFGMSSGLIYPPGCYSNTKELIELGKILNKYGLIYTTHLRNEGYMLMEALEEAIKIGEEANIPVEVSHHKAVGKENWGKIKATLREMEIARNRGVEINCNVYPYTACSTTITSLLPIWVLEGSLKKMLERLKTKEIREIIKTEIINNTIRGENWIKAVGWNNIVINECKINREYEGKSLYEIFSKKSLDKKYDEFFDFIVKINANASIMVFAMNENDIKTIIKNPLSAIASDSWALENSIEGKPHPRAYGTFPRILGKYVREEKLLSLQDAIRKMTSLPALRIGLKKRGLIREGYYADIVIFDQNNIKDKATYNNPCQYPNGINYVIVNGQKALSKFKLTKVRSGKIIRKNSY